jgi:hypothetical protein
MAAMHTPGPWKPLDPKWSSLIVAGDAEHPVAEVRGWGWLQKKGHAGAAEQDANLYLLAAAPTMLAALKKLREAFAPDSPVTADEMNRIACEAIDAAEKR